MNVFGGEDRFWLGPEGGQFALYFKQGDPFDFDRWQVPEAFDWGSWPIASRSPTVVRFHKPMTLVNYAGTRLTIDVDRTVRLLTSKEIAADLGTAPGSGVQAVAFESSNSVTNRGAAAWSTDSGLVSIWILGQFNPTPRTTIALPIVAGSGSDARPDRQRRIFREGSARSADGQGIRGALPGRRPISQQDRPAAGTCALDRRQLRCRCACADARAVFASRRTPPAT